jgi:hypothetical protein
MEIENKSEHIKNLAQEILDDIELGKTTPDAILLKATRLCRLTGNPTYREWLKYEMSGYGTGTDVAIEFMNRTGRWIDKEQNQGHVVPFGQVLSNIDIMNKKLEGLALTSISGDWAFRIANDNRAESNAITKVLVQLNGIKSKVIGLIHDYAAQVYYEKMFSGLAETTFETFKQEVDDRIADACGAVLEMIPSVFQRLAEGDKEAISHALTSCRRIIDAFADNIFPPSDETFEIDGNALSLAANRHQNRINVFIHKNTTSKSRKAKLRQTLANLYDRISSGVHNEVSLFEARSLFLELYIFLGEVLTLGR